VRAQGPEILIAASSLDVQVNVDPEMSWLPEMLLSFSMLTPAGWSSYEETHPLTGEVVGVAYSNHISENRGAAHPFLTEAQAVMAAVKASVGAQLRRNSEYQQLDFLVNRSETLWGSQSPTESEHDAE
jgi:hypothetical protein